MEALIHAMCTITSAIGAIVALWKFGRDEKVDAIFWMAFAAWIAP